MARDLDPSLLRIFLTCVSSGSISRAAQMLGRSQPTLSEQLRRLEDVVGSSLLIRSRDGVTTTEQGERLLPYARRIVGLSEQALRDLSDIRSSSRRHVGVGIMDELTQGQLPAILSAVAHDRARCSIEIVSLSPAEMRSALDQGRIQLMLGDSADVHLTALRRWTAPLSWVASSQFDPSIRPLPLIVCSKPCRFRQRILAALDDAGVRWRIALESTTLVGVQAAVSAGVGTAALFSRFAPPDLVRIDEELGPPMLPAMELVLVRADASRNDPLVDAVAEGLILLMDQPA